MMREPKVRWHEGWWLALIRPSISTFEHIATFYDLIEANHRQYMEEIVAVGEMLTRTKRLSRYFVNTQSKRERIADHNIRTRIERQVLVVSGISMLITLTLTTLPALLRGKPAAPDLGASILLCLMWGGIAMFGFNISMTVRAVIAEIFGGGKQLGRLSYVCAAYFLPVAIIMGPVRVIPLVGWYAFGLRALYGAVFSTMALKAVYKFAWWKTLLVNTPFIIGAVISALGFSPIGSDLFHH